MTVSHNKRWLVTGASGFLGSALCAHLAARGEAVLGLVRNHALNLPGIGEMQADLLDSAALDDVFARWRPAYVVHAAAMTDVDACEAAPEVARTANVQTSAAVAAAAAKVGAGLCYISTDQLWDGTHAFYCETDEPTPVNVYGRTKWEGEQAAQAAHPGTLVARTNFFGRALRPWHKSWCDALAAKFAAGEGIIGFSDVFFTPIGLLEMCGILHDLIDHGATGVYNVAGSQRLSKFHFARAFAEAIGSDPQLVREGVVSDVQLKAQRPKNMALSTAKIEHALGHRMPDVGDCLEALIQIWGNGSPAAEQGK